MKAWLQRFWGWLVAAAAAVAVVAGFGIARRRFHLGRARNEAAVSEALERVHALRTARAAIEGRLDTSASEVADLDAEITRTKREIVRLHDGGHAVAEEDLDDAFASLGY